MKENIISLFIIGTLILSPVVTQAQSVMNEEEHKAMLLEIIATLQKQIIALQNQLAKQQANINPNSFSNNSFQNSVTVLNRYNLDYPIDSNKINNEEHKTYFGQVSALFPNEYDSKLSEFLVFDGDAEDIDAFVETVPPNHKKWVYAVADNAVSDPDSTDSKELIVHELGHLISYDEVLGVPTSANSNCHSYFNRRGCPKNNSYLGQFTKQFWSSDDLLKAEQFKQSKVAMKNFYNKNSDEFANDYAASSPEEDFAESFMYFVFEKKVSGSIANQKIDFFRSNYKLTEIKNEVSSKI